MAHHDDAFCSLEDAELAKEPEPEPKPAPAPKPCPCRSHDCEVPEACSCGQPAAPLHECPYAAEIHNSEQLCDCCNYCTTRCVFAR